MERYTYRSLGQGSGNIRLLQLLPGSSEQDIRGEILHYSIRTDRNHGLYEALSYVWGKDVVPQRTLIGMKDMRSCYLHITTNLHAVLRQMRDPDLPRMLWIDAIFLWLTRYYNMLRYVCDCWEDYAQLKAYVSQLRWSNWLLSSQYTGDPTSGFWLVEGILNLDLFDLLRSAGRTRMIEERTSHEIEQQIWKFGEDGLLPMLDTLALGSMQIAATAPATHGHTSSAALIRQRIFCMIFSSHKTENLHPKAMLDMLDSNPDLFEATKLSLTIFSEISGMKAELTTYILQRLRRPKSQPNWELWTFLLEQSSTDTDSVIAIFEEAQVWSLRGDKEHHETCSQFLMPCAAVLCKYILKTDLCIALIEQWETEVRDTPSVLEFLCNTYTLPFKDMVGFSEGELIRSSDYPRSKLAQVGLARGCLLAAIRIVAPWVDNSHRDLDSTGLETDVTRILALLQLLWSSK